MSGVRYYERGSGRTKRLMESAPRYAVFVWCNEQLRYPKELADKHKRSDLKIVGPSWINHGRYVGLDLTGIVLDHDAHCDSGALFSAGTRIRKHA